MMMMVPMKTLMITMHDEYGDGNDDDNDDDNEDENSNGNDLIQVFPAVKQLSSSDLDYNYIFHGDGAVCI